MLLRLKSKVAVIACLGLAACARSAPELPADYASVNPQAELSEADFDQADLKATCGEIAAEKAGINNRYGVLERQITSTRKEEQTAGYLSGVLFPPAALAIDRKEEEKARLDEMQARLDKLGALSRLKTCLKSPLPVDAQLGPSPVQ
ncbi:hypothetical protein [Pelagibius sp. Alg239-R121]|uniref:hypothetical protein n=1 Tax=Pelagibius sp. Alg239-R121 TaxID=2993448 RepID=UPI0024A75E3E|nr:hypothetical protein [Pelagibius sp. Alg239-R121]